MAAHQAPPSLGFSRQEHWSGLPFPSLMHESEKWKWSHSVVSDPQRSHGLQPSRLLRPWDFPGKSGVPLPSPSPLVSFNLFFLICSMPDVGRLSSHPRTWIPLEDGSHLLECSRERRVMWLSDNDRAAIPTLDYQVWASFYTKERWTVLSKSFLLLLGGDLVLLCAPESDPN